MACAIVVGGRGGREGRPPPPNTRWKKGIIDAVPNLQTAETMLVDAGLIRPWHDVGNPKPIDSGNRNWHAVHRVEIDASFTILKSKFHTWISRSALLQLARRNRNESLNLFLRHLLTG